MNLRDLFKTRHGKDSKQQFFHVLFEAYYEKIYKTILLITGDAEISKDMTQETFLKVWTNIYQLRDPAKFEAWLSVIATNKAKEGLRKVIREKGRTVTVENVETVNPLENDFWQKSFLLPEQVLEKKESTEEVFEAINQMDEIYKDIIILKYFWGLSEKEMAESLKIKNGTVKSRLHRAKVQIRTKLEEFLYEDKEVGVKKVEKG